MAPKKAHSFGIKNPLNAILADCVKTDNGVKKDCNPVRMENNRKAAARSRANKRAQAIERENTIVQLRRENTELEAKISELTHTVLALQCAAETTYAVWMDGTLGV
jgi:predicted RNase H-like nuclease (RuvC/YqgF family)